MNELAGKRVGKKSRVMILEKHPLARRGVVELIRCEPDLEICGEASSAEEGLEAVIATRPHLLLMGLSLTGNVGLGFIEEMKQKHPKIAVLVMSMHDEDHYAEKAFEAGARGYMVKSDGGEKLLQAIRQVLKGKTYLSEALSPASVTLFESLRCGAIPFLLSTCLPEGFEDGWLSDVFAQLVR